MKIIRYLTLSDIHLGHDKNDTKNIIKNLIEYFKKHNKLFSTQDILFIDGDIYDKLLMTYSANYNMAIEWLLMVANYCKKNNIKLRILEGTKSHDWEQASLLPTIFKDNMVDLDFKYINTITIEKMHDLNLTILYIPDEYKHKASETYEDVLQLLKDNGLTQVDIAHMHGQFHYQLPMVRLESSHNEEDYLNIVKYFISIGHIHKHSINGKILAQGSFDRLAHGEEEPKGGMYISINKLTEEGEYRFIENSNAMIFKTFNYENLEDTDIIKQLPNDIKQYPVGSNFRLLVSDSSNISYVKKEIKTRYKSNNIIVESKSKNKDISNKNINIMDKVSIDSFHITKQNLKELLFKEMEKYNLTNEDYNILNKELEEVM